MTKTIILLTLGCFVVVGAAAASILTRNRVPFVPSGEAQLAAPFRVYIQTDPVVSELQLANGDEYTRREFAAHDAIVSYGENFGAPVVPPVLYTPASVSGPVSSRLSGQLFAAQKAAWSMIGSWVMCETVRGTSRYASA